MRNEDELKNLTRKKSLKSDYNFFGNLFIKCPSLPVFVKPRSFEQTMCVCLCVVCVCVLPFISFTSDPSIINNNITSLYRLSLDLCMHVCFSLCVWERERLGVYMWSQYCSASCLDNGHTNTKAPSFSSWFTIINDESLTSVRHEDVFNAIISWIESINRSTW